MKKVLYSVLALAGLFTLSCAKEIDAPNAEFAQENLVPLTLTASYDVATKVTYEGLKTFGWEANDSIKVRCVSGDNKEDGWYALGAKAAGATAQFVGDVPDTYTPRDYAFYPGFKQNITGASSAPAVRLPVTYYLDEVDASSNPIAPHIDPSNCTRVYVSSANPLQFLPSVGSLQEGGSFKFQAAYGVLNIQMTDLDDAACGLKLNGLAETYMGNYLMLDKTDLCYKIGAKYVSPSSGSTLSTTNIQYWFYPKADHTASIYLPVPVGTLPTGCSIDIVDEKGTVLYTQPFAKDVEVQRGKITTLAPFKAKYDWKEVGTGRFFDKKYVAASGLAEGKDVEVKIMQEVSNPNKYRVVTPYAAYNEAASYTPSGTVTEPNDLYFTVHKAGDIFSGVTIENDGIITFDKTYMGFIEPSQEITGGIWCNEQEFDDNLVTVFSEKCLEYISTQKQISRKELLMFARTTNLTKNSSEMKEDDIQKILNILVFDGKIEPIFPVDIDNKFLGNKYALLLDKEHPDINNVKYKKSVECKMDNIFEYLPCFVCPAFKECKKTNVVNPIDCPYNKELFDLNEE